MPEAPRRPEGSRPDLSVTIAFWALVGAAAVGFALWLHARDTGHGDRWDWSDWLEAAFAASALGIVIVGVAWVTVAAAVKRARKRDEEQRADRARDPEL